MRGANARRTLRRVDWLPQLILSVVLIGGSVFAAVGSTTPKLQPHHFSYVSGSLSESGVLLEQVQVCGCWTGVNGQSQKKVKFKITNLTDDTWVNLEGGPDSSIYLIASYPNEFLPQMMIPDADAGTIQAFSPDDGTPPNARIRLADASTRYDPVAITNPVLISELGVDEGWTAWLLPANPHGLVQTQSTGDGNVTYPTMVTDEWVGPGESYYDDDRGWGAWVFYLPLPPEFDWMASSSFMPTGALESSKTDLGYKVLGVGVLDDDGRLLGFAPLPPETVWSDGADF